MSAIVAHGSRGQQLWSASASDKLWECGGYLALSRRHSEGKENPASAWGTACHQLSERCLADVSDPADHIGEVGRVLSPSRPTRRWKTYEDEKLLKELSEATGLPPEQLVSRKPLSPAQLEKVLGKARAASIDGLWVSYSSSVKLAKAKPGVRTIHDRAKNFFGPSV